MAHPLPAPKDLCQKWVARALHRGLELGVFGPDLVVAHVTAEVLATHLPPEVLAKLLSDAMAAGRLDPSGIVGSVSPPVLAAHVPLALLWTALEDAAKRAGLSVETKP